MKISNIIQAWEKASSELQSVREVQVKLSLHNAARVAALTELFPGRSEEEVISDLLAAALDEVEATLPYRAGQKVVAEDELGDPIYEDAGLTPRFHALVQKYREQLGRGGQEKA